MMTLVGLPICAGPREQYLNKYWTRFHVEGIIMFSRWWFLIVLLTLWLFISCHHQVRISPWPTFWSQQGYLQKQTKGRSSIRFEVDIHGPLRMNIYLNVLVTSTTFYTTIIRSISPLVHKKYTNLVYLAQRAEDRPFPILDTLWV